MNIYAYQMHSKSARSLADALDCNLIRHEQSRFRGNPRKTVINWGSSNLPEEVQKCRVLNKEAPVRVAGNKLATFQTLQNKVSIPEYTVSRDTAITWLETGRTVVARKSLTGHSGHGIVILEKGHFEEAPLYTTYVPKSAEYRVHVMNGRVIDVQRKVKDPEREVLDWKVRSHDNGFIFIRNRQEDNKPYTEVVERAVLDQALLAVKTLGLDFAGVDVIWNAKKKQAFVLEGNCAVGLEGESVRIYAEAFKREQ